MGWIVRLYEKLTGTPHRHEDAERVSRALDGLTNSIEELSATLKPYSNADDPLVAFMTDVLKRRKGSSNEKPKLHS